MNHVTGPSNVRVSHLAESRGVDRRKRKYYLAVFLVDADCGTDAARLQTVLAEALHAPSFAEGTVSVTPLEPRS